MKLLGWMHRKLRQNSSEPHKDSPIGGQKSLDDLHYFPKPGYLNKSLSKGQRDCHFRQSFAGLEAARIDENLEEESSDAISELFHGFLAIGTLGSESAIVDPSTPTFSFSVETIAEKETGVTKNDLKLINDELEKVLGADESCSLSSGRNSHVSTGRSSHCSTITLSGKPLESAEAGIGNETITCPLQEYLFGSAIDLPEIATPPPPIVSKKEHRTSLGELFQKTKLADENNTGGKCERGERRSEKEADKSAVNLMKKMLKKKIPHTCETKKMQHKILQMFHRKIHPENTTSEDKFDKNTKSEIKGNVTYKGACNKQGDGVVSTGEDIIIFPNKSLSKGSIPHLKNQSNPPQLLNTAAAADSNDNRECWIKTDADYLVLEL